MILVRDVGGPDNAAVQCARACVVASAAFHALRPGSTTDFVQLLGARLKHLRRRHKRVRISPPQQVGQEERVAPCGVSGFGCLAEADE